MSNDVNSCSFIGRLGADPEMRAVQSGDAVTNFRIACGWKTKDKEGCEWISIVAFGKLAEICGQYLKKGSQVFIEGRMRTRKYTDKNGIERYATEIVADKMQMLGAKGDSQSSNKAENQAEAYGRTAAPSASAAGSSNDGGIPYDDDIPFMRIMGPW